MRITWDPRKAHTNRTKHGLTFEDAQTLFEHDADYLVIHDAEHSIDDRFFAIGPIRRGVITVVFVEHCEDEIRLISARRATPRERALFRAYTTRSTP